MKRKLTVWLCAAILFFSMAAPVSAYFNRGTVTLSLGQTAVSLEKGAYTTVSVNIAPIKELQLPGCGMAECPQSCGGTGCLNENGECTCGGTEYQTYYSSVSAVSSNTSVAGVSYANGSLTVTGVSPGTAAVTVTGSMRQYTDAEQTLQVTVTEPAVQPSQTQNSSGSAGGGNAGGSTSAQTYSGSSGTAAAGSSGVAVVPAGNGSAVQDTTALSDSAQNNTLTEGAQEDGSGELTAEGAASDEGSSIIETARGEYEIVPLSASTDVQWYLQSAMDHDRFVTFQKKEGENVEYSWTFDGKKLTEAKPLNLIGTVTTEVPEELASLSGREDGLLLNFEDNALPAEADLYVRVSSSFEDGDSLTVRAASDSGTAEVLARDVAVENGYATFSVDRIRPMMLSQEKRSNAALILGILACCAAASVAGAGFFLKGDKKPADAAETAAVSEGGEGAADHFAAAVSDPETAQTVQPDMPVNGPEDRPGAVE